MKHEAVEKNVDLLMAFILLAISIGGMVQIFPQIFEERASRPINSLTPLTALQLEGRDIYIREGCNTCHTQMVRTLQHEVARYGHYSVAGEDAYEHPFLWGSKRTGPDLARIGGRYGDDWHAVHLMDPRSVVPVSNMPAYPWLFETELAGAVTPEKMRALRILGVPYSDQDIEGAASAVSGKTEAEALIAYLQSLGLDMLDYGETP